MPGPKDRRSLVSEGTGTAHQCFGADSSAPSNSDLHKGEEASTHSGKNRQYYSQVLHQSYRGNLLSNSQCNSLEHMELVPIERHLHLSAEYLPGVESQIADAESRHLEDRCDWMFHPQVFEQINSLMGPLDVDLFASRLTHQLPKFFSWKPDLEAEATDAFTQSWSQIYGYANPPWCLILTALTKIRREEARIALVASVWKTQPWYPLLLDMLTDVHCLLPQRKDLVISPSEREFIMPTGVPQLAAWPLSGKSADRVAFQQKLHSWSQLHCVPSQLHLMNPSLGNGTAGVHAWNGVEIPLRAL